MRASHADDSVCLYRSLYSGRIGATWSFSRYHGPGKGVTIYHCRIVEMPEAWATASNSAPLEGILSEARPSLQAEKHGNTNGMRMQGSAANLLD